MLIEHRITVPAPPERVWAFMMDIPAVGRCVPGLNDVARIDDRTYSGVMHVRVGPIAVKLDGRVLVAERDEAARQARMDLQAADKRVNGAVNARMRMQLAAAEDGSKTDVAMVNEVLCKFICHNICCVIMSQLELGIEPVFWAKEEAKTAKVPECS